MSKFQGGLQKGLRRRGISPDEIVTSDNFQILITQESVIEIANKISAITHAKLSTTEIEQLIDMIGQVSPNKLYKRTFSNAQNLLARMFINRKKTEDDLKRHNEDLSVRQLAHLDVMDDEPQLEDYQKKEIMQMTYDENQYKYSTFADRRGNAILDKDRVDGNKSAPDGLPSGKKLDNDLLMSTAFKTLKTLDQFLDAESVDGLFKRFNSIWTTYFNINLPHQTVQLDSRNRLLTNPNPMEYKWNVHAAGTAGHLGDVRIQDTLKEVIQMKIDPFWIPVLGSVGGYYQKVRLLIKEFISQSIQVTEFLDPTQRDPTSEYYHWEFDVVKVSGDRIYIVPNNPIFIFRKPFARVETITFIWRLPFQPMPLAPDRGTYTITYGVPTLFTLTSGTNNFLNTGDLVYIINSDSGNTAIDDELNRQDGYIITKLSNTEFTIPVDTSILPGTQTGVNVYYGSKRIFTQIEFTSLEQ